MLLKNPEVIAPPEEAFDFVPVRILEIDLGQPLPTVSAFDEKKNRYYQRANCLIRLHTQPLGVVELELDRNGVSANEYAPHIWQRLGTQINEHLQRDGLPAVTGLGAEGLLTSSTPRCLEERQKFFADAPFVSVIVSTRDRLEGIQACLRALMALDYPHFEIIIVDNAPSTNTTADFIRQAYGEVPQVRYVREDRPGLSLARNCGMMAAKGDILAITDDDVAIDPHWLTELVRGFYVADDVVCVTGLVLPLELETPAQFLLEEYGGFSKGFTRRIYDMKENYSKMPLYPYASGRFGTGASMAFRTAFLRSIGGFDPALGVPTPAKGGEDLAILFQVISQGYKLVYEPSALLYHPHRRDYPGLRKQMYHYGIGLTSYVTKIVLDNPRLLFDLTPKLFYGLFFILSAHSSKNEKKSARYPKELTHLEVKGMLYGPFAYFYSRWVMREARKEFAPSKARHVLIGVKEVLRSSYHSAELEESTSF